MSKVISALEYFTDVGIKQHLEYALHNVISNPTPTERKKEKKIESVFSSLTIGLFKPQKNKKRKSTKKSAKDRNLGFIINQFQNET